MRLLPAADAVRHQIRQAASKQKGVEQRGAKTIDGLTELSLELSYNQLQSSPLNAHVTQMGKVLGRAEAEYIGNATRRLQGLVYAGQEKERGDALDEIIRLQAVVLEMLDSIRNVKLSAAVSRIEYRFQMALGDQEKALEDTKRLIFNREHRVPIGRRLSALTPKQRDRLKAAAGLQCIAEDSLVAAVAELERAAPARKESDPETGERLDAWISLLKERKAVEICGRASKEILNNMLTQALKTEQEVVDALETLLGRMQAVDGVAPDKVRVSDLAKLKRELEAVLARQQALTGETGKLFERSPRPEFEEREETQQILAGETDGLSDQLDPVPPAKTAAGQALAAMSRAVAALRQSLPESAVKDQQLAEKSLTAAILALQTMIVQGDDFERLAADDLRKDTEAVYILIRGIMQLIRKQEPLKERSETLAEAGQSGREKAPALAAQQETVRAETVALQEKQKTTFELTEDTVKIIETVERTLGTAAVAMGGATGELKSRAPDRAVMYQDRAIKELREAHSLLTLTHEALQAMGKVANLQERAITLAKLAELQSDLMSQVEKGEALEDVRELQEQVEEQVAAIAQQDAAAQQVLEAMEKAKQAIAGAQKAMGDLLGPVSDAMKDALEELQEAALASHDEQAEKLGQLATNQLQILQQAGENTNPEKLPEWGDMQQDLLTQLVEMMDAMPLDPGAGPPADEAVEAMEEALEELDEAKKKIKELILPPMEEAQLEMLAALSTMQTAATETFQVMQEQLAEAEAKKKEAEAAARYKDETMTDPLAMMQMPKAGPAEQGGQKEDEPKPPPDSDSMSSQQSEPKGEGSQEKGWHPEDLLEIDPGQKWTVEFAKRKRLGLEQAVERTVPAEYRGIIEGYFRRLAVEGSR